MDAFDTLSGAQLDLLFRFTQSSVKYVVIGGYAVRHYGNLRETTDLDLVIDRSKGNVDLVCDAMQDSRISLPASVNDQLRMPNQKCPWFDVEILSSLYGLKFKELFRNRDQLQFGNLTISIIGVEDLIRSKQLAIVDPGRDIRSKETDQNDLAFLLQTAKGAS